MASILIVDDERQICELLDDYLGRYGHSIRTAFDAAGARAQIGAALPDLVILDIHMPGEDGLSLARWLREAHPAVGIVLLTTAASVVDRIVGMELGADDYIPKPFDPRELLARLKSLLRRLKPPVPDGGTATPPGAAAGAGGAVTGAGASSRPPTGATGARPSPDGQPASRRVRFGRCLLDLNAARLYSAEGDELPLSPAEFDLLRLFAENPRRALNRDQIMEGAHQRGWEVFDRSIDLRVMRLRRKIETNPEKPEVIKTVRGIGYMFVPDPKAGA